MAQKMALFIALLTFLSCKRNPSQTKGSGANSTKSESYVQSIGFHREGLGQAGYHPGKWYILTQNELSAVTPDKPRDTLRLDSQLLKLCLPLWIGLPSMLKNETEWGISESEYDGDGWKMIVKYADQSQVTIYSGKLPEDLTQFKETVWKVLIELEKKD